MIFCGWTIVESSQKLNLQTLDIHAIEKRNIVENPKISDCEKKILIQSLDFRESRKQENSDSAFFAIQISIFIFFIQVLLFFGIIFKK